MSSYYINNYCISCDCTNSNECHITCDDQNYETVELRLYKDGYIWVENEDLEILKKHCRGKRSSKPSKNRSLSLNTDIFDFEKKDIVPVTIYKWPPGVTPMPISDIDTNPQKGTFLYPIYSIDEEECTIL